MEANNNGLELIDNDVLFAQYWTHPDDPICEMEHKSIKCAEILVPDMIDASSILGHTRRVLRVVILFRRKTI